MYVPGNHYNILILLLIRMPIILLFMNSLMPRDIAVKGAIQATRAIAPRNIRYMMCIRCVIYMYVCMYVCIVYECMCVCMYTCM